MRTGRTVLLGAAILGAALLAAPPAAAAWRGGGHNGFAHGVYEGGHRGRDIDHGGHHGGWRHGDRNPAPRGRAGRGQARGDGMPSQHRIY